MAPCFPPSSADVDLRALVPQGSRLAHSVELNLVGTRLKRRAAGEDRGGGDGDEEAQEQQRDRFVVTLAPMDIRTFLLSVAPAAAAAGGGSP